ncbi:MAG: OmpA family protein [Flavobacteriales bacterium]
MNTYKKLQTALLIATAVLFSSCATLYYNSGKEAGDNLRYQDAIFFLEKSAAKKESPQTRRMLAESYLMTNNYAKAEENYALATTATDNTDRDRINQARALMANGKYNEARTIFEGIVSRDPDNAIAKELLTSCKRQNDLVKDSLLYLVSPANIPNTFGAYSPAHYNGGLIFSSPAAKGDLDPYTNKAFTDLYFTKLEGVQWTNPEALSGVNGKFHDAVGAVSPSGSMLIFTRSFQLNGGALAGNDQRVSNTQLYTSKSNPDGTWEKATVMPFCDSKYMFAHPAFTKDGNTLYFSSDMPGGKGGMDIWESKLSGGTWGAPRNLGSDINTKGDEVFPTTHENDVLYFSSDAHQSLGGLDIVFSRNNNGSWAVPTHVSYPINTSADDFSMIWNEDNEGGFLSSDRSGTDRIYSFTAEDINVSMEGLVTGKDSMLPLGGVKVRIKNVTDGTEQMVITDGDGKFKADLEKGKDYQISTELEGYFKESNTFNTKDIDGDSDIQRVIELKELYVSDPGDGTTGNKTGDGAQGGNTTGNNTGKGDKNKTHEYDLPEIHWDYNKWDIRSDAVPYLDNLVKLFRDNPDLKFELRSHTDCRGSFEYNDDLSYKRAKAATDYLISKGVPRSIIVSKGFGEHELLNECTDGVYCTEDLHEQNRRTEFIVTGKKVK